MRTVFRNPIVLCIAIVGLALLIALGTVSMVAFQQTRSVLMIELAQKAVAQAKQTTRRVDYALSLGIPLDRLTGLGSLFDSLAQSDGDIAFLAVLGPDNRPVLIAGASAEEIGRVLSTEADDTVFGDSRQSVQAGHIVTRLPVGGPDIRATVVLGYKDDAASRPLRDNMFELAILLVVVLLLAFEVIALLFTLNVVLPARTAQRVLDSAAAGRFEWLHGQTMRDELGRVIERLNAAVSAATARLHTAPRATSEPRLIGARFLAFFFVFAEELARPVMVPHFTNLALADGTTAPDIAIGWSVAANLIAISIVMPLASLFYSRIGRHRMYLAGAFAASIGLVGAGFATDIPTLIGWRFLTGCGYALTFVACQGFVLDSTAAANRASGIAMMVGGIMLADICGPALGSILSTQIGYHATFLVCAGMPLLAVSLMPWLMGRETAGSEETPSKLDWSTIRDTLANRSLVTVLILIAAPAKLLLAGYLYYLVPMYMLQQGASVSEIGRVIMLYGLVALIAGPLFARLGDRRGYHVWLATSGTIVSGAGLLAVVGLDTLPAIIVGVVALGFGQALSIPAQVAIVIRVSGPAIARHGQGPVLAAMRLVERAVAATAPILAATITVNYGAEPAIAIMGACSLAMGIAFTLVYRRSDIRASGAA